MAGWALTLADPVHLAAAAGAFQGLRFDHLLDPGQALGQVPEVPIDRCALLPRRWRRRRDLLPRCLNLRHRHFQILEGELALVPGQLFRALAVNRVSEFLDQVLEASVGLGQFRDSGLLGLEGRPVRGRQDGEIEIADGRVHAPDLIPRVAA